jgi:SAM-dependent methyltransferase
MIVTTFVLITSIVTLFWVSSLLFATIIGAPTVYSNTIAITDALKMAGLKRNQLVIDLGCGDAKSLIIAAKKFGARGVGVERSPYFFLWARFRVFFARENKRIKIYYGDFKKVENDLRQADVIYLYLLNSVLARIEEWYFANIKDEAKTVSLAFQFINHKPVQKRTTFNLGRTTELSLYRK